MNMRQRFALAACAMATAALSTAWATTTFKGNSPSGAHYSQGAVEPTCGLATIDDELSVACTGTAIAGVGNTNAALGLLVASTATVQCRNGGSQIVDVKTQLTQDISPKNATDLRNGTLYVDAISAPVPTTSDFLSKAKCPNRNWTKELLGDPVTSWRYTLTFNGFSTPVIVVTGP